MTASQVSGFVREPGEPQRSPPWPARASARFVCLGVRVGSALEGLARLGGRWAAQ